MHYEAHLPSLTGQGGLDALERLARRHVCLPRDDKFIVLVTDHLVELHPHLVQLILETREQRRGRG